MRHCPHPISNNARFLYFSPKGYSLFSLPPILIKRTMLIPLIFTSLCYKLSQTWKRFPLTQMARLDFLADIRVLAGVKNKNTQSRYPQNYQLFDSGQWIVFCMCQYNYHLSHELHSQTLMGCIWIPRFSVHYFGNIRYMLIICWSSKLLRKRSSIGCTKNKGQTKQNQATQSTKYKLTITPHLQQSCTNN